MQGNQQAAIGAQVQVEAGAAVGAVKHADELWQPCGSDEDLCGCGLWLLAEHTLFTSKKQCRYLPASL